jgi:hypothetical protein
LGTFLEGLATKDVGIFMDIWSILQPFGILYGLLVYFMVIWYIFSRFGMFAPKNLATLVLSCFCGVYVTIETSRGNLSPISLNFFSDLNLLRIFLFNFFALKLKTVFVQRLGML